MRPAARTAVQQPRKPKNKYPQMPMPKINDMDLPAIQSPKTLNAFRVETKPIRPPSGNEMTPKVAR